MFKNDLPKDQMSDAVYIEQAAKWSREIVQLRARGPGDTDNAMRSIEREYGVDYWFLWSLRYRKDRIKEIGISAYLRVYHAWQAEKERQAKKHRHDIDITKAICGPDHPAVVAAQALARAQADED